MPPQAGSAVGDEFVRPDNFDVLLKQLQQPPYVLILVGPPGVGKTFVAEKLVESHERGARPFEVVRPADPSAIRLRLASPCRQLFYLDDPWGTYKLAETAARWTVELPRLIRDARGREDKRFLVTSRTALLLEGVASATPEKMDKTLRNAIVTLTADNFDARARRMILMQHMTRASRAHRDWVDHRAAEIVGTLTLPHSLIAFAQFATEHPVEQLDLAQLLSDSNASAIGHVVAARVRDLGGIEAAAILWALLSSNAPFNEEHAATVMVSLRASGLSIDLSVIIKRLMDDCWLAKREGTLVAHPTVIEGLEQLATSVPGAANFPLSALLRALTENGFVMTAVQIAVRLHGRKLPIPPVARDAIEAHLRASVLLGGDDVFAEAIDALGKLTSARDPVALMARALAAKREGRRGGFGFDWAPPTWTAEQTAAVAESADAEQMTRRYIRDVLDEWATERTAAQFIGFLKSLGWELGADFATAARQALESGSDQVILLVYGALAGTDPPYDLLMDAALASIDDLDTWWNEGDGGRAYRAALQGETDAAYAAFVLDDPGDRYHTPQSALKIVVAARRKREGYEWILRHPRRDDLIEAWAEAIPDHCAEDGRAELLALLGARGPKRPSEVFDAMGRSDCRSLVPLLRELLASCDLTDVPHVWGALFGLLDIANLIVEVGEFLRELPWTRRASLLFALIRADIPSYGDHAHRDPAEHIAAVGETTDRVEARALKACFEAECVDGSLIPSRSDG